MIVISADNFEEIADHFKSGEVIVFPTETSYGIGCDATNGQAVKKVIEIKKRDIEKGVPVLIHNLEEAELEVELGKAGQILAAENWPGALSIVAPVADSGRIHEFCHKDGAQCLRVSSSHFIWNLMRYIDFPIVATSANIAGDPALYSSESAAPYFESQELQPDVIVDAGELKITPASTIVQIHGEEFEVIRQGSVKI